MAHRRLFVAIVGLIALGVILVAIWPPEVAFLIALSRLPAYQAKVVGYMVPGGEMIEYSWPMKRLIELGDRARGPLHRRLADESIRNEVALVLGAIGDETTVPLLIEAFPEAEISETPFDYDDPDPARVSVICFTRALNDLTGAGIGHSRWGTEFQPGTKQAWRDWWSRAHKTFWVRDDGSKPNRALKTVPQILAQLDRALLDEDSAVRTDAASAYAELGPRARPSVPNLIAALRDGSPEVREAVASTFYFIGPDGADGIQALLDVMRHDKVKSVRSSAQSSLARIGEAAFPHLVTLLTDESAVTRRGAIRAIGEMQPKRKGVLPMFHKLARDSDADVRSAALGYMEMIDSDDPNVFAALVGGLKDPAPVVRRSCAYHLGRMGVKAAPATEALVALMRDEDAGVRRATLYAFEEIRSLTEAQVPLLIEALRDETWEVRAAAATLLSKIGPSAKPAVAALRDGLTDPCGNVRWWSAEALGAIGPAAQPAVPRLIEALADPEDLVRWMATRALKKIDPAAAARAGIE